MSNKRTTPQRLVSVARELLVLTEDYKQIVDIRIELRSIAAELSDIAETEFKRMLREYRKDSEIHVEA